MSVRSTRLGSVDRLNIHVTLGLVLLAFSRQEPFLSLWSPFHTWQQPALTATIGSQLVWRVIVEPFMPSATIVVVAVRSKEKLTKQDATNIAASSSESTVKARVAVGRSFGREGMGAV